MISWPRSRSWQVAKAGSRTGAWRSGSFASWEQAGQGQGDLTLFCFDVGTYKLVRLKTLQEGELQKGQIFIKSMLKEYIFKDFVTLKVSDPL